MISGEHDFAYHPVLAEASSFLQASNSSRFLLVGDSLNDGDGLPEGFEDIAVCRQQPGREGSDSLPTGNYRFRAAAGCAVMLVTSGASPAGPQYGDGMTGSHAATNGTTGRSAAASRTRLGFAESVQRSCLRERRRRSDGSPRSSATASSP